MKSLKEPQDALYRQQSTIQRQPTYANRARPAANAANADKSPGLGLKKKQTSLMDEYDKLVKQQTLKVPIAQEREGRRESLDRQATNTNYTRQRQQ